MGEEKYLLSMNGIEFAPGVPGDEDALVKLWNQSLPSFPMTLRLLRQTLRHDPYFEPEGHIVARHKSSGDVVGWVLSKSMQSAGPEVGRFQNRGGVGALCVAPEFQRQGIGKYLLARADEHLQAHGSPLTTLYFPHHFLPGVPSECVAVRQLFESFGCTGWSEHFDLQRDLSDYELPLEVRATLQRENSVEIRAAREDEASAVIAFAQANFPGAWTYSTRGHFERGQSARDFIIAVEAGEVIGFCHVGDATSTWLIPSTHWFPLLADSEGKRWGGLGPIGMSREVRGRGLGLALCARAVEELKERGVVNIAIDWTTLLDFYGKLGFGVWKRYLQGERALR
jgi:GNAT superfamily N-acetyltransferase